jgi:uncharacterized membrane protein
MKIFFKIILSGLLLTYLYFGLSYSKKQGFWHDEIYTFTFLKGVSVYNFDGGIWTSKDSLYDAFYFKSLLNHDNFYSNFSTQILHEGHPPLYFILLKLFSYAFGDSEVALRGFSILCGISSFLVLFNVFKKSSKKNYTAWLVLLMLIFNPFLFYFFSEARMYALAFFAASLSFRYWLDYQDHRKITSKSFIYLCICSVSLLYTHYYGLFFISTLVFIELLKFGFKRSLFNYLIPFILFIPWCFAIRYQLAFHEVHWTDGIITFTQSIISYFDGIGQLLISPMGPSLIYEKVILILIFVIAISILFFKERKFLLILFLSILIYGLQIFVFDQIVGHHSILVPRYFIFLLILIYWVFLKLFDETSIRVSLFVSLSYFIISAMAIYQIYKIERSPKQMFREVSGYLDGNFDSKKRTLVMEPEGPMVFGVAYYLHNNFKIVPASRVPNLNDSTVIYVDEMLGVTNEENKFHNSQQGKLQLIPFAGVFLYK